MIRSSILGLAFMASIVVMPVHVGASGPIVSLSPGSAVTAQDLAQFDQKWMTATARQQRLADLDYSLKNRQATTSRMATIRSASTAASHWSTVRAAVA